MLLTVSLIKRKKQLLLFNCLLGISMAYFCFFAPNLLTSPNNASPLSSNSSPIAFAPGISLIKTGVTYDEMDNEEGCDSIEFTYTVTNQSTNGESLDNIEVTDVKLGGIIPGPTSGDDNINGFLDLNEIWVYTATYIITQSDVDNTQIAGNANVTAHVVGQPNVTVEDLSDDNDVFGSDATMIDLTLCQPNIALVKTGVGVSGEGDPENGIAGCDAIVYNFAVTSEGFNPVSLENIVITDPLLPNLENDISGPDGDFNSNDLLDPNETWVYQAVYDIIPTDISNGSVTNQATVTANIENSDEVLVDLSDDDSILEDDETIINLSLCQPNIAMIKSGTTFHSIEDGSVCKTILYEFLVASKGLVPEVLENIVITDPLLPDLENIIKGPFLDDNNNGLLDPGEEWRYTAIYTITFDDLNMGEVINQASVTANIEASEVQLMDLSDDDNYLEDDETVVDISLCQEPEIGLLKTGVLFDIDNDGCDDHIQYTFTATNIGNVDLVNIGLQDALLGGEVSGPQSGDVNDDSIMAIGEEWVYIAAYDITQTDIDNGNVQNIAQVTAETFNGTEIFDFSDETAHDQDNFTTVLLDGSQCDDHAGPMGLIKEGTLLDIDNDGCDDHIQYTFMLTNISSIDIEQVTLNDPLLGGNIPGPESGDDGNDGILGPGEVWIYSGYYDIQQSDIDNGQVLNQANASGVLLNSQVEDDSDDDSYLEDEETIVDVSGACDGHDGPLGLIKMGVLVDANNNGCNETIEYTFTVRNQGPIDLDQITLVDNDLQLGIIQGPDSGDTGNDGVMGTNEEWVYTAQYDLTQADIDAAQVINQASVSTNLANIQIIDLSDNDSYVENDPTITSTIEGCIPSASIGLIKQAALVDTDDDGCNDSIQYTFTVLNQGNVNLVTVELVDDDLQTTIVGPGTSDVNSDAILSVGEEWTYSALYDIVQQDVDEGQVQNQAEVTAIEMGTISSVSDLSDNDSYAENDFTITSVVGACAEPAGSNFEIFNGITPNGDGYNDYFHIEGIENYPDNTLQIFNRWGVLVYEADGYGQGNSLFRGISDGRTTISVDKELPSGTYFYVLTFQTENPGKESYSGYLFINRD